MQNANLVSLRARVAAAAFLALAVAGCGSGKTSDQDSSQKTVWDHFAIGVGGHPAMLQVAVLPAEQERGLMQRSDLGRDEGMIFVNPSPRRLGFWMHNTPEALDLGYITPDGVIAEIYPLLPFDERTVSSHSDQVQHALEMPQGWFASNGIRPGARLDLKALGAALKARGFEPAKFRLE
ncbi:MAG TPA: DUF192 domain-containing protein [Opitutaceae bacterium]|nr:DUF192 domain-containing protein [Opitutaceae bacterium]